MLENTIISRPTLLQIEFKFQAGDSWGLVIGNYGVTSIRHRNFVEIEDQVEQTQREFYVTQKWAIRRGQESMVLQ